MQCLQRMYSAAAAVVAAMALCSCVGGSKALVARQPAEETFRSAGRREPSSLNFTVEASAADLARTLNQVVGSELYRGSAGTGVNAVARRTGAIGVSASDNWIYLTVPVSLTLSCGMFEAPPLSTSLKFRVGAGITPDWRVTTDVAFLGLTEQFPEKIGVGLLSLRPRTIVEGMTQPVRKMLSEAVARKINESFPLRAEVERAWRGAQKPLLLDARYRAWLRMTPLEVVLSPLTAANDRLRASVGITSYAELVVGPEPPPVQPLPLPRLKPVKDVDRTFRVALNVDLFYRDLLAVASPLLLSREFESDGRRIVVRDFDLYGNGDRLVVKVATSGDLEGVFFLTCKPGFDPQSNLFTVRDLDFDVQTRSLLIASADWFLHGTLRDAIRERLNLNIARQLEQSREMAQKAVGNVSLADNLYLRGSVKSLRFGDALVQKDRISLQVYAEGETAIVLQ